MQLAENAELVEALFHCTLALVAMALAVCLLRGAIAVRVPVVDTVPVRFDSIAVGVAVLLHTVAIRMSVSCTITVHVCSRDTVAVCMSIGSDAIAVGVSIRWRDLRALASCLRKREDEEDCLKGKEHESDDCRCGVHVQLEAGRVECGGHGLRSEIGANWWANAEADCERDANMRKGFGTGFWRGDVGKDGAA